MTQADNSDRARREVRRRFKPSEAADAASRNDRRAKDVTASPSDLLAALGMGGVGILSWDLARNRVTGDPFAAGLWGLERVEGVSLPRLLDKVHPADRRAVKTAALQGRRTGRCHVVFRVQRPTGGVRWLRIRGGISGGRLHGVVIDVSERRSAEEALERTQARLTRAQRLGGTTPFEWDVRSDEIVTSAAFNELYGVDADLRITSDVMRTLIHPDDQARLNAQYAALLEQGGAFEFEYRIRPPGGGIRWILSRGEAIVGPDGRVTGLAGIAMDVTARKAMEQAVRDSEAQARARLRELEALYRNAPVGLGLLDRDLRFVRINDALAEMNGLPAAAHIGRYAFDLVPDLREAAETLLNEVMETGRPVVNVALSGQTPKAPGETREWLEQFYPVTDDGGNTVGVGIVCEDVTDRRRAERARDLLSRELSHRIKNLFSVVASLITLSARGHAELERFARVVRGRLEALGRAHDYVRPTVGEGGDDQDSERNVRTLLTLLLAPYGASEEGPYVEICAEDQRIGAQAATSLALAVHELATNAAKYGALSQPGGRVRVSCRTIGGMFSLTWRETGGPPIDAPPEREGFGSTLARRALASDLGGTIGLSWERGGLTARILAPAARLGR